MDMNSQIREGVRLLVGIEEGTMPSSESYNIIDKIDCVMTSLVVRYLRKEIPSNQPSFRWSYGTIGGSDGNLSKIVNLVKEGEQDPISEWFSETYSFREFYEKPEEFIQLIVENLRANPPVPRL